MDNLTIFSYNLPGRRGALIKGAGWGEVAPLPSWSEESYEQALAQLRTQPSQLFPSVAFGLETARLPLPQLPLKFPVAALLKGTRQEILQKAVECKKASIQTVKVKLSELTDAEALDVLKQLSRNFRIRLDLNRKWDLTRSLAFFSHFRADDFEFIEEPCTRVEDLHLFPFPIGLDESLRGTPWSMLAKIPHVKALIFKPTLQGGVAVGKKLAELAHARGVDLIFSSAYETGVGITQIALLAHHLNMPIRPLGIDTYSYLEKDVLKKRLRIEEGFLHLDAPLFDINQECVRCLQ